MRSILFFLLGFILISSCSKEATREHDTTVDNKKDSVIMRSSDTTSPEVVLVHDYFQRVIQVRAFPNGTIEEQVKKYEILATFYLEYAAIHNNLKSYSPEEQKENADAYMIVRDEIIGVKEKLRKNITAISVDQEKRLDAADAEMNKILPNVYKEVQPEQ